MRKVARDPVFSGKRRQTIVGSGLVAARMLLPVLKGGHKIVAGSGSIRINGTGNSLSHLALQRQAAHMVFFIGAAHGAVSERIVFGKSDGHRMLTLAFFCFAPVKRHAKKGAAGPAAKTRMKVWK